MYFSTLFGLAALVAGITATPITERQDASLIVFKVYSDVANCSPSPSQDRYNTVVIGLKSQAEAGECHQLNAPVGWDGVKMEARFPQTDFNFTTSVYTSDDCTAEGDDEAWQLNNRVCIGSSKNFKSWKIVKDDA